MDPLASESLVGGVDHKPRVKLLPGYEGSTPVLHRQFIANSSDPLVLFCFLSLNVFTALLLV